MKFKVGDYVKNIKHLRDIYLYGLIIGIESADDNYSTWIEVLILCSNKEIIKYSFREYELELLDKNKINHFNKLRVFK